MGLKSASSAVVGAVIGGATVWLGQTGSLRLWPAEMTYADLAAILLSAVGVIVAIFGGVLALAAIWGFKQLKQDAIRAAEKAGAAEIREQIENGSIRAYIADEIGRQTTAEIASDRMERRIRGRVDAVVFGRPDRDPELEEDI